MRLVTVLVLVLLAWPAAAEPAGARFGARGLSAAEIDRLAEQLGGEVEAQRVAAYHALSELHAESLPGIAQRLQSLRRNRPDAEAAKTALAAFRHAVGSRRADDSTDIAPGVLAVLAQKPSAAALALAEPLLLMRSLERIGTREAGVQLANVLLLDDSPAWDTELRLARERAGMSLLPALVSLRSHPQPRVRAFAQAGVRALGMEDPAVALKLDDAHLVAELAHAYADPLEFAAMPALVRLTASNKLELREAARASVARFGKNAIWQLRELYDQVASKSADREWDAERCARELYAALDAARAAEQRQLLEQGMSRFVAGDLDGMRERYDRVLALDPHFAEREKLAPGYAALAQRLVAEDALERARDAYQRALRLAPHASDARSLRAELAYVDAELALGQGIVDLHAYAAVLQAAPGHAAAAQAKDRLSGARAAREYRDKRIAAIGAIVLLLGLVALLLRGRSGAALEAPERSAG